MNILTNRVLEKEQTAPVLSSKNQEAKRKETKRRQEVEIRGINR